MTGVDVSERRTRALPRVATQGRALGAVAEHWAIVVVLAGALALRVLAFVAIYPGIWFSDTNNYVTVAATGTLSEVRVGGYALVVAPFWHLGSAAALVALQHLLGLGIVALLYALLVRRGAPRRLAVLGVLPAALDAYLIDIEHAVMSDTVFHAAVVAAVALLLWRDDRPRLAAAASAGLLLGYAGVVRSVGAPFFAVFVLYMLVRRVGWRPLVVFCAGWALVNVAYLGLYDAQHGKVAYSEWGGRFLYARVATWADCSKLSGLPADERRYCPDPRHRMTSNGYLWGHTSPIHGIPDSADPRVRDFAMRVIENDPARYARSVAANTVHFFRPGHPIAHNDYSITVWQFPADPARPQYPDYRGPIRPHEPGDLSIYPNRYITRFAGTPRTDAGASRLLRDYQRVVYTPGPLLLGCVLVVLVGLVLRRVPWRLKLDSALLAACTLASLVVASALSVFSYRYGLIGIILLPAAAALAGTGMVRARAARP